jgi:hypothetical protein
MELATMDTSHKLVLTALFASVLAACGGGGGGSSPSAGASSGEPLAQGGTGDTVAPPVIVPAPAPGAAAPAAGAPVAAAPAPADGAAVAPAPSADPGASPPAPVPSPFRAFGPTQIGENPFTTGGGAIARLAGGGNVVLWTAHGSTARSSRLMARLSDPAGNFTGEPFVVQEEVDAVAKVAVAAAPDGGFLVAWSGFDLEAVTPAAIVQNLQVRRYSADGVAQGTARLVQQAYYDVQDLVVEPVAGGYVVGWSSSEGRTAPSWGHLQRLGPAGELAGARVDLQPDSGPAEQRQLSVVPLPDGTVAAVWEHSSLSTAERPFAIAMRRFDANLQPLEGPTLLAGSEQAAFFRLSAAAAGSSLAIAWAPAVPTLQQELRITVVAPGASSVGPVVTVNPVFIVSALRVLPLGAGEFGVAWQETQDYPRGTNALLYLQRHDATLTASTAPSRIHTRALAWVSEITGNGVRAGPAIALAAGADGHLVATYQQADATQPNQYVFGQ